MVHPLKDLKDLLIVSTRLFGVFIVIIYRSVNVSYAIYMHPGMAYSEFGYGALYVGDKFVEVDTNLSLVYGDCNNSVLLIRLFSPVDFCLIQPELRSV